MSDVTIYQWVDALAIPTFAATAPIVLFWLKFRQDAKKKLDELLLELEHKIYMPEDKQARDKLFRESYIEIRKAIYELERWTPLPNEKEKLKSAYFKFRGARHSEDDIFKLIGTEGEPMIDVFVTNSELCCLTPNNNDYREFIDRIATLRKITGSRRWRKKEHSSTI